MSVKSKNSVEATIEASRTDCWVTNVVSPNDHGAEIKRLKIGPELTLHKITCSMDRESMISKLRELRGVIVKVTREGKKAIWAKSVSCTACKFMSNSDMSLLSSKAADQEHVFYRVLVSSKRRLDIILKEMEEFDLEPRLVDYEDSSKLSLTDREREVLLIALKKGYFEPDRKTSMKEVAEGLGVSTSSLRDVLRRGLKKIVKHYFDDNL